MRSVLVRGLLVVGFFSCITNVLMLTTPIYMLQMFDRVLSSRNFDTLVLLTVIAGCALITLSVIMIIRSAVLIRIGTWIDQQIGSEALMSAISTATKKGKVPSSRIMRDLGSIRKFFSKAAIIPLFDAPWSPIFILLVFLLSPVLGAVALVGLALMLGLALGHDRIVTFLSDRASAASRPANRQVKSMLQNADVAESMGMVPTLIGAWSRKNTKALDLQASKQQALAAYSALTQLITQGMRVAMLCAGAMLVINDKITTGVMLASAILASRAIAPMTKVVKAWRSIVDAHQSYQRLRGHLESTRAQSFFEHLPVHAGKLSIRKLVFRYPVKSSSRVLRGLSVELRPGEVLCVVGPPGSGKSTFAKLIAGILEPYSGQVRFGGTPVSGLSHDVRAAQIGYLPPDLQLFDGTIHENISRMRLGIEQSVVEAARMAGIHDAIVALSNGYDTVVVDNELPLSPGEKRQLSISRAIFGRPGLVVLDEPTLNLDRSNERNLIKVIQALKNQGTIVVIVSHRANILRCADQVLMLPSGKITSSEIGKNPSLKVLDDSRKSAIAFSLGRDDG